jgi:hypothetical protein
METRNGCCGCRRQTRRACAGEPFAHLSFIGRGWAARHEFHIAHLARSGLVSSRQESRFIYYFANFPAMDELIAYLTENCCQGQPCLTRKTRCL